MAGCHYPLPYRRVRRLDVYKRQGHTHVKTSDVRDGVIFANPGSISLPKDGSNSYGIVEPVSYTHLDVYKRQQLATWAMICVAMLHAVLKL